MSVYLLIVIRTYGLCNTGFHDIGGINVTLDHWSMFTRSLVVLSYSNRCKDDINWYILFQRNWNGDTREVFLLPCGDNSGERFILES